VVIIKSDEHNRNKWKLGIVEDLIAGRDGVVRVAKLRAGKSHLERAVQHLYPLELSCDVSKPKKNTQDLDPNAQAFRLKRDAAAAATMQLQDIAENEEDQSKKLLYHEYGYLSELEEQGYFLHLTLL
jgi:hypothetical protein